jgi:hypothetical protein
LKLLGSTSVMVAAGTEAVWDPLDSYHGKGGRIVTRFVDRPFDWVTALAVASGAVVVVPSLVALGLTLVAVIMALV